MLKIKGNAYGRLPGGQTGPVRMLKIKGNAYGRLPGGPVRMLKIDDFPYVGVRGGGRGYFPILSLLRLLSLLLTRTSTHTDSRLYGAEISQVTPRRDPMAPMASGVRSDSFEYK